MTDWMHDMAFRARRPGLEHGSRLNLRAARSAVRLARQGSGRPFAAGSQRRLSVMPARTAAVQQESSLEVRCPRMRCFVFTPHMGGSVCKTLVGVAACFLIVTSAGAQASASAPAASASPAASEPMSRKDSGSGRVVHSPQLAAVNLHAPQCVPSYPTQVDSRNVTGVTRMRVTVSGDRIASVEVVGSSGPTPMHKLLDSTAASATALFPVRAGFDADGHPLPDTQLDVFYRWGLGR